VGEESTVSQNKPFHLTPASLPTVARSAAGERQRSPHKVEKQDKVGSDGRRHQLRRVNRERGL